MNYRIWTIASALSLSLGAFGCADDEGGRGRGGGGKADLTGSCEKDDGGTFCGGPSDDGCWCNDSCLDYNDCCSDWEAVCEGGGETAVLDTKSYDVLFTNPLCKQYDYAAPIKTADGSGERTGKPKNVYCTSADYGSAGNRPISPQYRLVEWIESLQSGDEVFMAYLSYSNVVAGGALCDAAERGVKITFVLDGPTSLSSELEACGGTVLFRGHAGGIGYAHNKIFMVNANAAGPSDSDSEYMRLAFSSGNMSSGVVLHHENWHFLEVKRDSYFAGAHRCLMGAQLDEDASSSKANYREYLNDCRDAIPYPEEEDIKAFFIPNRDDSSAVTDLMVEGIETAKRISIGAHRFSYRSMLDALEERLHSGDDVDIRLVADDDLYWLLPYDGSPGQQLGDNSSSEAWEVKGLYEAGGYGEKFNVKYMETNHDRHFLHHNKFLIFEDMPGKPDAVLYGAANLTGTGFWTNFENIYYSTNPDVVDAFKTQYARFWDGEKGSPDEQDPPQATWPQDMPVQNVTP